MKCQATSDTTHSVLISKEIGFKSYKEICSGETKKVNLGYLGYLDGTITVENNTLVHEPHRTLKDHISDTASNIPWDWEVLSSFFLIYNIEQNWLHCNYTHGHYDEELGGFTGCVGKV